MIVSVQNHLQMIIGNIQQTHLDTHFAHLARTPGEAWYVGKQESAEGKAWSPDKGVPAHLLLGLLALPPPGNDSASHCSKLANFSFF